MISAGFNVLRTAWRKPRPLPQAPDELGKTGHGILWLDIDDMLLHVVNGGRMTGIHRYVTEVAKALLAEYGPERVRLVRHGSLLTQLGGHEVDAEARDHGYQHA